MTWTAVEFAFKQSTEAPDAGDAKITSLNPELELFVRFLGIPPNIETSRLHLLRNCGWARHADGEVLAFLGGGQAAGALPTRLAQTVCRDTATGVDQFLSARARNQQGALIPLAFRPCEAREMSGFRALIFGIPQYPGDAIPAARKRAMLV